MMNCRLFIPVVVLLIITISIIDAQNTGDEDETCEPNLADKCFNNVVKNLRCLDYVKLKPDCGDICKSSGEALQCISDIIDTDCGRKEGRDRFDSWLRGLRAVYYTLCGDNSRLTVLSLTQNVECWNPMTFVNCVRRSAGIEHVNDLLRLNLDMNQCNRLMISITTCNVQTTSRMGHCSPSLEGINEIIHSFFSKTECGRVCRNDASGIPASFSVLAPLFSAAVATYYNNQHQCV